MGSDTLTLSVCLRCRDGRETHTADLSKRGGRRLSHEIAARYSDSAAAQLGVQLRGVNCMSQCKRPCAIALSGPDRFSYLFGDLDPLVDADAALAVAEAYARSGTGFLDRAQRPKVLQGGILGRIPPLGFAGDLVEPLFPPIPKASKETDLS